MFLLEMVRCEWVIYNAYTFSSAIEREVELKKVCVWIILKERERKNWEWKNVYQLFVCIWILINADHTKDRTKRRKKSESVYMWACYSWIMKIMECKQIFQPPLFTEWTEQSESEQWKKVNRNEWTCVSEQTEI